MYIFRKNNKRAYKNPDDHKYLILKELAMAWIYNLKKSMHMYILKEILSELETKAQEAKQTRKYGIPL